MESVVKILAKEFNKNEQHIKNVIDLIDEGNTIPFIARYRKEMHGTMDDTALRDLADRLSYLRNLETRREEVKKAIAAQDKLTDELSAEIDAAATLAEVRIYTARISRNAVPARPSQRKKGLSRSL